MHAALRKLIEFSQTIFQRFYPKFFPTQKRMMKINARKKFRSPFVSGRLEFSRFSFSLPRPSKYFHIVYRKFCCHFSGSNTTIYIKLRNSFILLNFSEKIVFSQIYSVSHRHDHYFLPQHPIFTYKSSKRERNIEFSSRALTKQFSQSSSDAVHPPLTMTPASLSFFSLNADTRC